MDYRIEEDSYGKVQIPADALYGKATQRSLDLFHIGQEKMPLEVYEALIEIKRAAALANRDLGGLSSTKAQAIAHSAESLLQEVSRKDFPLSVWQTGSGTQSNMNVNEVLANHSNQLDAQLGLHPNDDVNKSQSTNDVFPSAMHIAAYKNLHAKLLPELAIMIQSCQVLAQRYREVYKVGRTHLQDATPMTLGQEIYGWQGSLEHSYHQIQMSLNELSYIGLGGTAVGTGINAPEGFGQIAVTYLSESMTLPFQLTVNPFYYLTSQDAYVFAHGALKGLASNLMKIANDVRFLASGPRAGIQEITIQANEAGSSIMPGKVNPTQSEALLMVCAQVLGNDTTIGVGASLGNYQLNVMMPVLAFNMMQSINLLTDAMHSFRVNCLESIQVNESQITSNITNSLMIVTALNKVIGYDKATQVSKLASEQKLSVKDAVIELGYMDEAEFEATVNLAELVHIDRTDFTKKDGGDL